MFFAEITLLPGQMVLNEHAAILELLNHSIEELYVFEALKLRNIRSGHSDRDPISKPIHLAL